MNQKKSSKKLSAKQQRAIVLIVEGESITKIASEIGVDRSTIYRWQHENPVFMAELGRVKSSLWDASQEKLRNAWMAAIDAIIEMLDSEDERMRMKAAELMLGMDIKAPSSPTSEMAAETVINKRRNDEWLIHSLSRRTHAS